MKRVAGAVVVLVMAAALTACGPSREQLNCEESGGVWSSRFSHYTYVLVGKVLVPQPVYLPYCAR